MATKAREKRLYSRSLAVSDGVVTATSLANSTATIAAINAQLLLTNKIAVVPLAGATIHGGVQAWANPEAVAIIIDRIEVDVTTIATGAGTLSVGATAVSISTASANLIDTLDVHTATGIFDNITDKGSAGKSRQKLAVGKWVTFGEASGDVTGLVGNLYVHYHLV